MQKLTIDANNAAEAVVVSPAAAAHGFSFEVLPPPRGKGVDCVYRTIDRLMPYNPACVNITTHRTETIYNDLGNGTYQRLKVCSRPGTVAIAAAIKERYGIHTVPHVICSGYTAAENEMELIDLSFLGITDIMVLRGDRAKDSNRFVAKTGGHSHADELCRQVNEFNAGHLLGGVEMDLPTQPFTYGVAAYPEKHDEAMNLDADIENLKAKVAMGANRIVTQLFFDNQKYFDFVKRLRAEGITVPVIPGIKPLTCLNHRSMLPRIFHIDFPAELAKELSRCQTDDDVKALGVEWGIQQVRDLKAAGVTMVHFFTMNASFSTERIVKATF